MKESLIVLILIAILLLVFVVKLNKKLKEIQRKNNRLEEANDKINEKYKGIINKEKYLNELVDKSNNLENEINIKNQEAKKKLNMEIDILKKKIKEANEDSLKILENKKLLKSEVLMLEESLELQEYGFYKPKYHFENAEKYKSKIKEVKELQKQLIKMGKATICDKNWSVDGSEAKGKAMTKNTFKIMLRAFNGESDAAISNVKYNNINTMEKRIKKSFEVINKLNQKNYAYIVESYLDLKLQELCLTHEEHEKIQEEKEEQKEIKERIKEEERAIKEFEKVKFQARKEEETARKALEKAKLELEKVHGNKLEKLKEKMLLLEKQLKEAEENNQRATSMAQLTKSGYVYVISNIGSFGENIYKIGMTRRLEPLDRVKELSSASVPFVYDVHAMIYAENAPELEKKLHKEFNNYRVNKINLRKEFFEVSIEEIKDSVQKLHGEFRLTKLAEAKEYNQTRLIKKEK